MYLLCATMQPLQISAIIKMPKNTDAVFSKEPSLFQVSQSSLKIISEL